MALTLKQQRFVAEYLVDLNASAAARRAGYSEKTADVIGYENLQKPQIAEAIKEAQAVRQERTQITQDKVLGDILRIGLKAEEAEEFGPALKASELLGKHLGLFTDKVQLTGKDGGPVQQQVANTSLTVDEFRQIAQEVASKF